MRRLRMNAGELCDSKNYLAVTKSLSPERLDPWLMCELEDSPWFLMGPLRPNSCLCLSHRLSLPLPTPLRLTGIQKVTTVCNHQLL